MYAKILKRYKTLKNALRIVNRRFEEEIPAKFMVVGGDSFQGMLSSPKYLFDIYYPEDMSQGEESWSVDVYQDEVNERCGLNWTWTVISKKELEAEGEKEEEQPEWEEVVDEPFSEEVVCKAIEEWLHGRGYEFVVRMISLEQARGSGLVKELREREVESGGQFQWR